MSNVTVTVYPTPVTPIPDNPGSVLGVPGGASGGSGSSSSTGVSSLYRFFSSSPNSTAFQTFWSDIKSCCASS